MGRADHIMPALNDDRRDTANAVDILKNRFILKETVMLEIMRLEAGQA